MITRIRKQILSLRHKYTNPLDIQRARILLIVNVAVVVLSIITTVLLLLPGAITTGTSDSPASDALSSRCPGGSSAAYQR